jgi:hypothetical protein
MATTILTLANQVNIRVNDAVLTSLYSDYDNSIELRGYMAQAAAEVSHAFDWQRLTVDKQITTNGQADTYPLPSNFGHMLSYNIYNITKNRVIEALNSDEILKLHASGVNSQFYMGFRFVQDSIKFVIPPDAGDVLEYSYISKDIFRILNQDGYSYTYKQYSDNDQDEWLLDNELLILKAIELRAINLGLVSEVPNRTAQYINRLNQCIQTDSAKLNRNILGGDLVNKTSSPEWNIYKGGD